MVLNSYTDRRCSLIEFK